MNTNTYYLSISVFLTHVEVCCFKRCTTYGGCKKKKKKKKSWCIIYDNRYSQVFSITDCVYFALLHEFVMYIYV